MVACQSEQCANSYSGLVTLNEMKAKQEDVVKERERQIATCKAAEAHLALDDMPTKVHHNAAKQVKFCVVYYHMTLN